MHEAILNLLADLYRQIAALQAENAALKAENGLLRQATKESKVKK